MGCVSGGTIPPAGNKVRATPRTVIRAASLSKPVFADLVLKLADEGILNLDRPLYQYLSRPIPEYPDYADLTAEPHYRAITARMALSHTTGFPNWRWQTKEKQLAILFEPGTRFGYSGEGYRYLQFVVETITRTGLDELAREKVFVPLGMERSSYVWQPRFEGSIALDLEGIPPAFREKIRTEANAAGSLLTTAADYARFLLAAMDGEGLRQDTHAGMLKPQIEVSISSLFGGRRPAGPASSRPGGLAWVLGWGSLRSADGSIYFHVGAEPGFENYAAYFAGQKTGYVLLSSGNEMSTPQQGA
jgi:CubicO group peptidase (beta-lactamase class C family)